MQPRRQSYRKQTFLSAFVGRPGGGPRLFCLIRDLSPDGARLTLPEGETLPDTIEVEINGRQTLRAQTVWRRDGEVGIAFVRPRADEAARPESREAHAR